MKKLIFTIALAVIALSVNAKPKVVHVLSPDMKNSVSVSTDVGGFRLAEFNLQMQQNSD